MRNSICMLSFPISHIDFKKMCVVLIGLGFCFFTKRVHVLVKISRLQCLLSLHFKDFNVLCLLFSKDFNVSCLYISRLQCLLSLHFKTSMSSVFKFQDFNVFCLYFPKTSMSSVFTFQDFNIFCFYISKTSTSFIFTFSRFQCLQSLHFRSSMSPIFVVQDYNVFCLVLLILHPFILFWSHIAHPRLKATVPCDGRVRC